MKLEDLKEFKAVVIPIDELSPDNVVLLYFDKTKVSENNAARAAAGLAQMIKRTVIACEDCYRVAAIPKEAAPEVGTPKVKFREFF